MSEKPLPPAPLLPPPSGTILLYAADGLSVWKKHFKPNGFPQMPERAIWVPMFRELVNSDEGMQTLHALTRTGMQARHCAQDNVNSLRAAFGDITLRALMIATLEDYAETGSIRVLMPPPPSRPALPVPTPRPETAGRPKHKNNPTLPRRPSSKGSSPGPKPG